MTEPDLTVAPSLAQAGHRGYKSEGINDFDRKLSPKIKNASRDPPMKFNLPKILVISAVVLDYRKGTISAQLGATNF